MTALLLGLDVGTTASKAVAFTLDGRAVGSGSARTPWARTSHGTELDARALVDCARAAVATALAEAPDGDVLGLGVTGMGESGVLLDGRGEPVAPLVAWHDDRDGAEVADLDASIGADRFARRTGLPLSGQWSLTKHRWLLVHHPRAATALRRLNVAEWVVRSLGGEEASEQSLASRTGWLELGTREWWSESLDWSGIRRSMLPPLVTAGSPLGSVDAAAGVPRVTGAVLTVAGHDHQAATVGVGATGAGDELDSCGTAEALIRTVPVGLHPRAVAELARAGVTTGWHVLADRWCLLGGTRGGLVLQRTLALLGQAGADLPALDRQAMDLDPAGLTVDETDAGLRICGVTETASPARLWRAALETVAAQAAGIHRAMSAVAGEHQSLVVTGGWARSDGLIELKRRTLGPLRTTGEVEAGARGAALLAGVAAGAYGGSDDFPVLRAGSTS
jgi:sugar (pentulose or hexulose) kinase